ncbi:uncharacterized protein LOC122398960 [Colletes gigas]|uniref:uncharacterized protein LOC122398960 n=1 Tax=Colletes gigas TaxID=935657 RepID=UPI001C9B1D95|nr:uncharacterized protein LOC122398960 [Colletes gigas]
MSTKLPTILLSSSFLLYVACEFVVPSQSSDHSSVYPFLEKWANTSNTGMLTVVFDDFDDDALDFPRVALDRLNVSTRLITLKHLMSLMNTTVKRANQTIESGNCVLLLFSNTDHLRDILGSPYLVSFWHPENVYFLQGKRHQLSDTFDDERFCRWAFERLWRFRRVYRLVFFTEDRAIRYDPFQYAGDHIKQLLNSSCDWFCVKVNEDDFLMVDHPNATDVTDFFDDQRRSFELYPLKISIFKSTTMLVSGNKYEGIDYMYLDEVTKMMNITPVLLPSKDKFGWEDKGVFYGTLGHLVYGYADVTFNQFFVKDYLTRQIEFTTAITSDKLCVLVPKAPPVPDHLIIVKTFSLGAWLLAFSSHFILTMIYTSMPGKRRRLEKRPGRSIVIVPISEKEQKALGVYPPESSRMFRNGPRHWKQFKRASLSCLASLSKYLTKVVLQLVQPFERSHPWFPERFLLMCSLWLSLILNGVFTSQLASSFSKRLYYNDIDTLEELEKSGLTILTNSRDIIEDALSDSTTPLIKRLRKKMEYANDTEIDRRLFETKDAAYLHRPTTLPFRYDEFQRQKLHLVKECPKDYILANVMTKGSPFRGRINSILGRLNNGGFYGKWYRGVFQSKTRAHRADDSFAHKRITMRHLFIPFGILYVGLTTSAIVFVCERRKSNPR